MAVKMKQRCTESSESEEDLTPVQWVLTNIIAGTLSVVFGVYWLTLIGACLLVIIAFLFNLPFPNLPVGRWLVSEAGVRAIIWSGITLSAVGTVVGRGWEGPMFGLDTSGNPESN